MEDELVASVYDVVLLRDASPPTVELLLLHQLHNSRSTSGKDSSAAK